MLRKREIKIALLTVASTLCSIKLLLLQLFWAVYKERVSFFWVHAENKQIALDPLHNLRDLFVPHSHSFPWPMNPEKKTLIP